MKKKENLNNDVLVVRDILPYIHGNNRLFVILNNKFHIGPETGFYREYIERGRGFTPFLMQALDSIVIKSEEDVNLQGYKVYKLYITNKELEENILEYVNKEYNEKFDYLWPKYIGRGY